ncbi:NACHT, LRR and PYD domains-containing protein 1-like isoform X1 [Arapaima gigas]
MSYVFGWCRFHSWGHDEGLELATEIIERFQEGHIPIIHIVVLSFEDDYYTYTVGPPRWVTRAKESPHPTVLPSGSTTTSTTSQPVDRSTTESTEETELDLPCEPPSIITPTVKREKGQVIYSVVCSHAGWFQCRETGLMFRMKDMGKVVYSTAKWDGVFQIPTGWMPAGPLLDIKCPQETVCEIKFPHCEIFTEDRRDFLSVAHVTENLVDILSPLEVTDTHVTVSIAGLSLFGLITSWLSPMVHSQVLLFLRALAEDQERILNVFLLPSNVLLSQVQEDQRGNIHIPTASVCTLTHEREYSVRCDIEEKHYIQPEKERFYRFADVNFYPTFEVFLYMDVKDASVKLMDRKRDTEMWGRKVKLPGCEKLLNQPLEIQQNAEFVDQHRVALIERVMLVDPILDQLSPLIHPEACARVRAAATSQEKMRLLYDSFRSKGVEVKSRFFEILKNIHPHLVRELHGIH